MKQLVIVQPYIPSYRKAFFDGLERELRAHGVRVRIAAGMPDSEQKVRGDASTLQSQDLFNARRVRVGSRSIDLGGSIRKWADADAVVLGLVGGSFDLYRAISRRRRSGLKVGVWGHIGSYVNDGSPIDLALERWQMRHVDHIFAYTPGGETVARAAGIDPSRITTVMNSVDTLALERASAALDAEPTLIEEFKQKWGIGNANVLAYIGGLDKSKRIDFLKDSLDHLWSLAPDVKVLVAGKGVDVDLLEPAVERGQVVLLGYADETTKALLGKVAAGFLMPGRVGLIAVESLLLRRPILTTEWPYHSVELEYLTEGVSKHTASNDSREFARLMLRIAKMHELQETLAEEWRYPTLEDMIARFSAGVRTMMEMK